MPQVEVQRECDACGGGGVAGIITPDMALDAGDKTLAGQQIRCSICGGDGWVPDVVEVEDEDA